MKGIELSQLYYGVYGRTMIREKFPEYEGRIAVGLVGQGSECFGYDDILSADHDYGPGFCMWLTDEDYEKIGEALEYEYSCLPQEFKGFKRLESERAGKRVGVMRTSDFYRSFIGTFPLPKSNAEWVRISEKNLATVTNGIVFRDDLGEFSKIRDSLLKFYPEDVRVKKIVARAAVMAQSGQYNYARCMKRGENVAAGLAMSEFVSAAISMVYLLNKRYTPYYKWAHHGLRDLKRLSDTYYLIDELFELSPQNENWKNLDRITFLYGINFKDRRVEIIEKICEMVLSELKAQGLVEDTSENFLEAHLNEMMMKIKDINIKCMHVMEG